MTGFERLARRLGEPVDIFRGTNAESATGGLTAPTWTNVGDGVTAIIEEEPAPPDVLAGGSVSILSITLLMSLENGRNVEQGDVIRRRTLPGRYYKVLGQTHYLMAPQQAAVVPAELMLGAPAGVLP